MGVMLKRSKDDSLATKGCFSSGYMIHGCYFMRKSVFIPRVSYVIRLNENGE